MGSRGYAVVGEGWWKCLLHQHMWEHMHPEGRRTWVEHIYTSVPLSHVRQELRGLQLHWRATSGEKWGECSDCWLPRTTHLTYGCVKVLLGHWWIHTIKVLLMVTVWLGIETCKKKVSTVSISKEVNAFWSTILTASMSFQGNLLITCLAKRNYRKSYFCVQQDFMKNQMQ